MTKYKVGYAWINKLTGRKISRAVTVMAHNCLTAKIEASRHYPKNVSDKVSVEYVERVTTR